MNCRRTEKQIEKTLKIMGDLRDRGVPWVDVASRLNKTHLPAPQWDRWTGDNAMKFFSRKRPPMWFAEPCEGCVTIGLSPAVKVAKEERHARRSAVAKRAWETRRENQIAAYQAISTRLKADKVTRVAPALKVAYSEAEGQINISLSYAGPLTEDLADAFAARVHALLG
jgi:hypothetical protein